MLLKYTEEARVDDALGFCHRAVRIGRRGRGLPRGGSVSEGDGVFSRKHEGIYGGRTKKAMALLQESDSKASQQLEFDPGAARASKAGFARRSDPSWRRNWTNYHRRHRRNQRRVAELSITGTSTKEDPLLDAEG